jgi:phenylacetate-CoA ligase
MKPLDLVQHLRLVAHIGIQYPRLARMPRKSIQEIRAFQLHKLKERLTDAHQTPMYQRRDLPKPEEIQSLSDWTKIPLLTKSDLLNTPESQRIQSKFSLKDLIVSKSSGSTGQALNVFYDSMSFTTFILAGLRMYRMAFDYKPWHRQTYIYTSPYPMSSLFGMFPMRFLSTLTPPEETLRELRAHPPDLLVCYPSHLRMLVQNMNAEDFTRIQPKVVNVNSEMSSPKERAFLAEKLGAFVFDDYSSEELTRIAAQCRHLNYHIFDDINYIEIVDDSGRPLSEGSVGHIVGTNLHNQGMPLIRYQQGDRGAIRTYACPCGWNFRILEKLEGRKNDSFLLPDGSELSSGFLLDLTYGIFLGFEGLASAFCLVQETPDHWKLEIVRGPKWSDAGGHAMLAQLRTALAPQPGTSGVRIALEHVQQVTRTKSGKSNPIISKVKR